MRGRYATMTPATAANANAFHHPVTLVKHSMQSSIMNLAVSRLHRLAACAVAGFILCVVLAVLPVARVAAPEIAPFLPLFSMAVFATEGLTAYLLWTQFLITRQAFLAALAGVYAYTAMTVAIQLLVFPGVFSATGLLGAGPQSAVWIWAFWHVGSPLLVMVALFVRQRFPAPLMHNGGIALLGVPMVLSLVACYLSIRYAGWLPDLVNGVSYNRLQGSPSGIRVALVCALALAYLVVATRLRTLLELWLSVAMLAGLGDVILSIVANSRYSIGWYVARLASVFASSAVLGVLIWEISHLYRELHVANVRLSEYAARDGLTGLYNRRYFDEHFAKALVHANNTGHPLSILMVDIDHFKRFNDTLGHLHGDDTLITVARTMQTSLRRSGDFVARYGGEEFVVVLPDCDAPTAERLAQTLRSAVARRAVAAPFTPVGHVTVSVGVATSGGPGHALVAELLARADSALYRAKKAGRNCVAA